MHDGVFLSVGVFQFFEDDCAACFFTGKGLECFVAACGSYTPIHSGRCRLTMLVKLILLMFQFFGGAAGGSGRGLSILRTPNSLRLLSKPLGITVFCSFVPSPIILCFKLVLLSQKPKAQPFCTVSAGRN